MITIESGVPIPEFRVGRKSAVRDQIMNALKQMHVGESFRVEYNIASMRNVFRSVNEYGRFKVAKDEGKYVRVWRVG